ncbi:MAG: KUP/HAK/KT family potassium transporter [Bryobacteraceae bacterium]|nr:KUP/HAK/KT family potassium transporter [Bryobacteraceae bacterium]
MSDAAASPPPAPGDHHSHGHDGSVWALTLGALGVVFGDIGTSPLYTVKECIHHARLAAGAHATAPFPREDLFGILSLIFWAMTLIVTVKYLLFIMRADNKGEGGIFALLALVPARLRATARGRVRTLSLLSILGAALLYGDGVITPAISVLSAVEGLAVASPALHPAVVPVAVVILLGLFSIQKRGTGTVGRLFGPVMTLWFFVIGVLGLWHIRHDPEILAALSPHYALGYFTHHGLHGFTILGSVVLAVTGGEALYADMGHFGISPIRRAWLLVAAPALVLNYLGQGATILRDPATAANPFFSMVPAGPPAFALVLLSSAAAVIASQALISGAFSLTRQAIQLGLLPRLRVRHTAREMMGQIYIPEVNFAIAAGCIVLVLLFQNSSRLAAAYGLAVTGTMAITSVMFYIITRECWHWPAWKALLLLAFFLALDLPFLLANAIKFLDGGYIPVIIGAGLLILMVVWTRGRTLIAERNAALFPTQDVAHEELDRHLVARVPGTAVFMASSQRTLPPILVHHVSRVHSLQEHVVLVHVQFGDTPFVAEEERHTVERLPNGFWRVILTFGFMEEPLVVPALTRAARENNVPFQPDKAVYFLGRENFIASKQGSMGPVEEGFFAFLQRNVAPADRFFGLPHARVVEIGTQIDL